MEGQDEARGVGWGRAAGVVDSPVSAGYLSQHGRCAHCPKEQVQFPPNPRPNRDKKQFGKHLHLTARVEWKRGEVGEPAAVSRVEMVSRVHLSELIQPCTCPICSWLCLTHLTKVV